MLCYVVAGLVALGLLSLFVFATPVKGKDRLVPTVLGLMLGGIAFYSVFEISTKLIAEHAGTKVVATTNRSVEPVQGTTYATSTGETSVVKFKGDKNPTVLDNTVSYKQDNDHFPHLVSTTYQTDVPWYVLPKEKQQTTHSYQLLAPADKSR